MPSIICLPQCCSWPATFPSAESSVLISLHEFLGFSPLPPLVWGTDPWSRGQDGFPGALEVEIGEHRGILPLQLPGFGMMDEKRDFLAIDVSQDLEELPGPQGSPRQG